MAKLGPTEVHGSLAVAGIVTKPLQPSFNAWLTSTMTLVLASTTYVPAPWTERFDIGSNFNATTGIFTAPIAGCYQFSANVEFRLLQTDAGYYYGRIRVNSRGVTNGVLKLIDPTKFSTTINYRSFTFSTLEYMDVGDTAWIDIYQSGGTPNTTTITGTNSVYTSFAGFLAC